MRIETLAVKGLTTFREELRLDFRGLPGGVIAVVGPNGAGKSSLMEAMFATFYGWMPSREKRPLVDLVNGAGDAFLECQVSLGGYRYRGRRQLDGAKRQGDALLTIQHPGSAEWVKLNDGKVSTYQAAVAAALPSPTVLLASAFAAQNRAGSFATADRTARKDLFAALLGLERFEAMSVTARSAADLTSRRVDRLTGDREVLDRAAGELRQSLAVSSAAAALVAAKAELVVCEQKVQVLEGQIAQAAAARQALVAAQAALDRSAERLWAAQTSLQVEGRLFDERAVVLEREAQALQDGHRRQVSSLAAQERALLMPSAIQATGHLEAEKLRRSAEPVLVDLDQRIANNRDLLDRALEVRQEAARVDELDREAAALATQRAAADEQLVARRAALEAARARRREAAQLQDRLTEALARAARLETTPFGQRCGEAGCAFVSDAIEAQRGVPGLQASLEALAGSTAAWEAAEAALDQALAHQQAVGAQQFDLSVQQGALSGARAALAHLEVAETRLADRQAERARVLATLDEQLLAVAQRTEATLAAAEGQRSAVLEELRRIDVDLAEELEAVEFRSAGLRADRAESLAALQVEVEGLQLQVGLDQVAVDVARSAPELLEAGAFGWADLLSGQRAALARQQAEIGRLEAVRAQEAQWAQSLGNLEATVATITAGIDRLSVETIEWSALAQVFGKTGLPVFEIDAAGPTVTALANDLLQACFGGRFSVELVTQEAKAGGKGGLKETFGVQVLDASAGGDTRDLADLSGGEQVIVDEALKSAIALFANYRSGAPIETCWRDETAGALRPSTALAYLAMLRRIRERGGFHHLFVVTHNPDLAALADVQLLVADGTARLVAPPFPAFQAV